jgi:glycine hydroxymethyltransferase
VADLIDTVLQDPENEDTQRTVEQEVQALCDDFPLYDTATAVEQS